MRVLSQLRRPMISSMAGRGYRRRRRRVGRGLSLAGSGLRLAGQRSLGHMQRLTNLPMAY